MKNKVNRLLDNLVQSYKKIGVVKDYIENEADQVIFIIEAEDGSEKMIPDIPEFISDVDLDEGIMYVKLIKGM